MAGNSVSYPPAMWGKRSLLVLIFGEALAEREKLELLCCSQLSSLSMEGPRVWLQPCTPHLPLSRLWNSCAFSPPVLNKNKVQNGRSHRIEQLTFAFLFPSNCWELFWGRGNAEHLKGEYHILGRSICLEIMLGAFHVNSHHLRCLWGLL